MLEKLRAAMSQVEGMKELSDNFYSSWQNLPVGQGGIRVEFEAKNEHVSVWYELKDMNDTIRSVLVALSKI